MRELNPPVIANEGISRDVVTFSVYCSSVFLTKQVGNVSREHREDPCIQHHLCELEPVRDSM